jgi:hypothetical protein
MSAKEPMFNVGDLVHYDGAMRTSIVVRRKCIWQYTIKDADGGYITSNVQQSTLKPVTGLTDADLVRFKAELEQAKLIYESAMALVERNKEKSEHSDE